MCRSWPVVDQEEEEESERREEDEEEDVEICLIEEFVDGVRPAWGRLCCEELL